MAVNITDFLKNHLFKSEFYDFYNLTVNVPYPSTFLYDDSILDYGQGQDYRILALNTLQLLNISKSWQEYDGDMEYALNYIYTNRNSGNSPLALIIIGESDEFVHSYGTQNWLKKLKSEGFVTTMAVSFGGYLAPLTDEPSKYYFKVNGSDPNSQQSIGDKLSKLIGLL